MPTHVHPLLIAGIPGLCTEVSGKGGAHVQKVVRTMGAEQIAQGTGRAEVMENQILLDEASGWWKTIDLVDSQA
jgi:hypothetical protein